MFYEYNNHFHFIISIFENFRQRAVIRRQNQKLRTYYCHMKVAAFNFKDSLTGEHFVCSWNFLRKEMYLKDSQKMLIKVQL